MKRHTIPMTTRLAVLLRDECVCQYCGKQGELINRYSKPTVVENPTGLSLKGLEFYNGLEVIPFELDHIIPISEGGQTTEQNLILSCRRCNRSKGARHG